MRNRESKYEILRIVAAVMILFNHIYISDTSDVQIKTCYTQFNLFMTDFFHMGGKFGVNLFLIIGCWFLADSVNVKRNINRIKKIILETIFYGITLAVTDWILFDDLKDIREFVLSFKYWYTFGYILMLVIIIFAEYLKKLTPVYLTMCSVVFCVVTIYGVIYPDNNKFGIFDKAVFIAPVYFTYIFLLVKHLKNKCIEIAKKIKSYYFLMTFVVLYILMFVIFLITRSYWIRAMFSPICLLGAFSLFMFIIGMKNIGYNRIINNIATVTYATYLIQCNTRVNMVERLIIPFTNIIDTPYYLIVCTLYVLSIFVVALILNSVFNIVCKKFRYVKNIIVNS